MNLNIWRLVGAGLPAIGWLPVARLLSRASPLLLASAVFAQEPVNFHAVSNASFAQPGGGSLKTEVLKGRPAVINFWATWCPPCREELPLLARLHSRYKKKYGDKIAFLGLAVEDNAEFVGEYAGAYGLRYPVAAGREPAIALMQALGNTQAGMPYTVVVNGEGRVVYAKRGLIAEKDLNQALAPLLKK